MRQFLAARRAACWLLIFALFPRGASAQKWNDSLTLDLVNRATARRAEQLADTGLVDYHATAHGYVTFLAQLGEGFRTPPKILKADELGLEVYWHAPNQSKQRIVGRRDTLLLPTDIQYHTDHLGIVQNNFPQFIRIGDGDEVRDVPHPLSALGLTLYDFALTDSFSIGIGTQRIRVREVKVRPKDDKAARVVGALYIDASGGQVVRMDLSFTRAAFLDPALEDLSVELENRLVGGRFWLPNRQKIELTRTGTYLDFPARGIIRGRWEIGNYELNVGLAPTVFLGQEIAQAPPAELKRYHWVGSVLDSLPPDVRAVTDEDIQRVQDEARALVRAAALSRGQHATLAARNISDIAHANRVEGLAIGSGVSKIFGGGVTGSARARYGIEDHDVKGAGTVTWTHTSGFGLRAYGYRDFRDVGDVQERSTTINSVASQEFGSDFTDPFFVRGGGAGIDFPTYGSFRVQLDGAVERQDPLAVHATPVVGTFLPTLPIDSRRVARAALKADRPPGLWLFGTELAAQMELRATRDLDLATALSGNAAAGTALRAFGAAQIERPFGAHRFVTRTTAGALTSSAADRQEELFYLGGTTTAPGYDYHSLIGRASFSEHLEWQMPIPFPAFSLGRFGRVPGSATFAPYVHSAVIAHADCAFVPESPQGGGPIVSTVVLPPRSCIGNQRGGAYPAFGAGFLSPFNLVRIDIARGVGRTGRWTFSVDLAREFWSIF